jgi:hypothetical protein
LLIFTLLFSIQARADSKKEEVRIVYNKSIRSEFYQSIKDYIESAYESIDVDVKFINYPVGRSMKEFREKSIDADLIRQKSTYKNTDAVFVPTSLGSLELNRYCLFYRCSDLKNKNIKDLVGVTIRGAEYLRTLDKSIKIILVDSNLQLVKMMLTGRADYIIIPFPTTGLLSHTFQKMGEPLGTFEIYHWVQKEKKHLVSDLNDYFLTKPFKKRIFKMDDALPEMVTPK